MNFFFRTLLFLTILLSFEVNANGNEALIDSLKKQSYISNDTLKIDYYRQLYSIYNNLDYDSGYVYIQKALNLVDKLKLDVVKGKILGNYANMLINKSLYQNAVDTLIESKNILETTDEKPYLAFVNDQIALAYKRMNKDADALEYFLNAWKTLDNKMLDSLREIKYETIKFKEEEKQSIIAAMIINIDWGLFYYDIDKIDQALEKFNIALDLSIWSNDNTRIAACYSNIAMVLQYEGNSNEALLYYKKAYDLAKKIDHQRYLASITNNMANIYGDKNDFENAEKYMIESLKYNEKNLSKSSMINSNINLGLLYLDAARYQDAEDYMLKGMEMAQETGSLFYLSKANEGLYNLYEIIKDYKSSLKHLKLFKMYADSSLKLNNIEKLNDLELEYRTEAKDKKIEFLEIEKEKNSIIRNYLIALIITLIAGISFVVILLLNRRKMNQKLILTNKELIQSENELREVNSTKDRFLSIIAHDIRNPLAAQINSMSVINKEYDVFEREEILEITDELEKSSRNLYQLLNDLLSWAKSQTNQLNVHKSNVNLNRIISDNILLFSHHIKEKNIKIIDKVDNDIYVYLDANMLNTIIRNLFNNAIKYTLETGEIKFVATKMNQKIELCVIDNGVGMSEAQIENLFKFDKVESTLGTNNEQGSGFGMILTKELVELNNSQIEVESKPNEGTTFKLILPQSEI